jgi:hypothetical protein
MYVTPLIVNHFVGLVQLHAPLRLAKRVEQVQEPSCVVQYCDVLLRHDVCDECVPVNPTKAVVGYLLILV